MGFYISIPGTITYEKNERLRSIVRNLPLRSLLVETDCPYLTPVPKRGKRNEPAYVLYTARRGQGDLRRREGPFRDRLTPPGIPRQAG